jgi:membrane protein required for colicin V production
MNGIDLVIVVLLIVCTALGAYWGLIRQVIAVVGLATALVLARRYGPEAGDALASFIASAALAQLVGFAFVFMAISALASLLASLIQRFAGLLLLSPLDRLGGAALGLLIGGVTLAALLASAAALPDPAWTKALGGSSLATGIVHAFSFVLSAMPDPLRVVAEATFGIQ